MVVKIGDMNGGRPKQPEHPAAQKSPGAMARVGHVGGGVLNTAFLPLGAYAWGDHIRTITGKNNLPEGFIFSHDIEFAQQWVDPTGNVAARKNLMVAQTAAEGLFTVQSLQAAGAFVLRKPAFMLPSGGGAVAHGTRALMGTPVGASAGLVVGGADVYRGVSSDNPETAGRGIANLAGAGAGLVVLYGSACATGALTAGGATAATVVGAPAAPAAALAGCLTAVGAVGLTTASGAVMLGSMGGMISYAFSPAAHDSATRAGKALISSKHGAERPALVSNELNRIIQEALPAINRAENPLKQSLDADNNNLVTMDEVKTALRKAGVYDPSNAIDSYNKLVKGATGDVDPDGLTQQVFIKFLAESVNKSNGRTTR